MVLVEYTGNGRLVLRGTVTGKIYRFQAEGMVLPVDRRDASRLRGVPGLRPLARP